MKIQLDTENKTIKIEGDVLISELIKTLDKLFPKKEYKDYTLITQTVIERWSDPIIIPKLVPHPVPMYPPANPWQPWIVWCQSDNDNKNYCVNKGVYNLEC